MRSARFIKGKIHTSTIKFIIHVVNNAMRGVSRIGRDAGFFIGSILSVLKYRRFIAHGDVFGKIIEMFVIAWKVTYVLRRKLSSVLSRIRHSRLLEYQLIATYKK